MFVEKTFNSIIPEMHLSADDITLLALVNRELSQYIKMLENAKLRDGLRHILAISRHGNQYIQAQQPWVKAKGTEEEKYVKSEQGSTFQTKCISTCVT